MPEIQKPLNRTVILFISLIISIWLLLLIAYTVLETRKQLYDNTFESFRTANTLLAPQISGGLKWRKPEAINIVFASISDHRDFSAAYVYDLESKVFFQQKGKSNHIYDVDEALVRKILSELTDDENSKAYEGVQADGMFYSGIAVLSKGDTIGHLVTAWNTEDVDNVFWKQIFIQSSVFVVMLLCTIITLRILLKKLIIWPLETMVLHMKEHSDDGNYAFIIEDKLKNDKSEFGLLARSFQSMVDNVSLSRKALIQAKEEAEHANAVKTEFISNISHELRTPMTSIIGFSRAGIKRFDRWNKEEHINNLKLIKDSGERLLLLINALLDLSKLEAKAENFDIQKHDLNKTIKTIVSQLHSLISEKQITVSIAASSREFKAGYDNGKISQVIINLLSNAIKFSTAKSKIDFKLEEVDFDNVPSIKLSITDRGSGIPEDELEIVFDKFIQSSKTKTGAGGTGLGLAICKEIIEAHGGKIWAENNESGGSTFSFIIPVKQHNSYKEAI